MPPCTKTPRRSTSFRKPHSVVCSLEINPPAQLPAEVVTPRLVAAPRVLLARERLVHPAERRILDEGLRELDSGLELAGHRVEVAATIHRERRAADAVHGATRRVLSRRL